LYTVYTQWQGSNMLGDMGSFQNANLQKVNLLKMSTRSF